MKMLITLLLLLILTSCIEINQNLERDKESKKEYKLIVRDGAGETTEQIITKEEADELYGKPNSNLKELKLPIGTWIHEKDASAGLQITLYRISMFTKNTEGSYDHDWYSYKIMDQHKKADTDVNPGKFLNLTRSIDEDTLSYEILNDGENGTISLLHLDSGRIHVYNKE
ncbi:hypothetical protein LX97_02015 [Nonlabens dokdonensis]|jgi:hypothetical protein|uniref:Lipoprotein n=2 Tax=Nonlabens dokdonensis TaxID=328515 RepID=L7WD22_NONDD|nr:hypothetical protein [Nonlabens dokdonensis]AGC77806.1 hypothetical protein DDD_2679 [Nonlabens dokdonensis DSW-6]PZX39661.1 hypothetical protein LX97_02015 [Nonlabens dokdonensis]